MDISRHEQRVLHVLAQGGKIVALKSDNGKLIGIECFNRDGWLMQQCSLPHPYRITRRGLELARSEFDNR
jgi:uncharacterized protein